MKNNSLHDIFQKIWLEKNRRGQPFTSVANNFLHLLGFEIGYPTVLLNKKNMVIVVVFTQKMIRHFKDEKYLCEAVQRHRQGSQRPMVQNQENRQDTSGEKIRNFSKNQNNRLILILQFSTNFAYQRMKYG